MYKTKGKIKNWNVPYKIVDWDKMSPESEILDQTLVINICSTWISEKGILSLKLS